MADPVLTIDFGTSYSSAVIVGATNPIAEPTTDSYSWPSSVYLQGDTLLVGTLAERKKRTEPAAFRTEFKRELGAAAPVFLGERTFAPVELATAVIRALKTEAERTHGGPIDRVVLTVPASYLPGDPRRALMIEAGEAAGFGAVELLAEPVAAAFAPGASPGVDGLMLVYDFGGGTFDTAVVRMEPSKHTVLGHAALDDCGGRDIDALVGAKVREEGEEWLAPLVETAGSEGGLRLRMAVGDFAQRVKHQLTDSTTVEDFLLPISPAYRLARSELAKLVEPQLRRTVDCVRGLLRRLRLDIQEIDAVLLVGGSSRMPVVAETLAGEFGRPLHRPEDPDLAVVLGAAEWSRRRSPAVVSDEIHRPGLYPLHWDIPGGVARIHRWLVQPRDPYPAGAALARVRLPDGALWDLTAAKEGVVERLLAEPGSEVRGGQWLALAVAGC